MQHRVEPSTDASFFVQFYRAPGDDLIPGIEHSLPDRRSGPWMNRGRDLDTVEEILEMVTRQYGDVVQDDTLEPYVNFDPGFIDWQAHIRSVADYWNHVLLVAPDYEIDTVENHRRLHQHVPFTPAVFDRWLQLFHDTLDGGCTGPNAHTAKNEPPAWLGRWRNDSSAMAAGVPNRLFGRPHGLAQSQP